MEIIIIDDEMDALATFLYNIVDEQNIKYTMFSASPELSIDYVRANNVAAAFVDINMPKIDGVALAERLIAAKSDIKIVFITGYAYDEHIIKQKIGASLLGYCHKPYDKQLIRAYLAKLNEITAVSRRIEIRTFDCFDLFINGKPVSFYSAKSKELLALLTVKRGAFVPMGEAIAYLWPDKNEDLAKRLYRDAIYRLRLVLKEHTLTDAVIIERAKLALNTEGISCDYWNFLDGNIKNYYGIFMPSYDWSLEIQSIMDIKN